MQVVGAAKITDDGLVLADDALARVVMGTGCIWARTNDREVDPCMALANKTRTELARDFGF